MSLCQSSLDICFRAETAATGCTSVRFNSPRQVCWPRFYSGWFILCFTSRSRQKNSRIADRLHVDCPVVTCPVDRIHCWSSDARCAPESLGAAQIDELELLVCFTMKGARARHW